MNDTAKALIFAIVAMLLVVSGGAVATVSVVRWVAPVRLVKSDLCTPCNWTKWEGGQRVWRQECQ